MMNTFTKKIIGLFVLTQFAFFSFGQTVLYEGFEGATFPPVGWSALDQNAEPIDDWSLVNNTIVTSFAAYEGVASAASFSWNSVPYSPDNWLITPQVNVSSADMSLSFAAFGSFGTANGGTGDFLEVYVSTTGTATTDFFSIYSNRFDTEVWEKVNLSLAAFTGQNIYIAFRHYNSFDEWYLALDEVVVSSPYDDAAISSLSVNEYRSAPLSQGSRDLELQFKLTNNGTQTMGTCNFTTDIFLNTDLVTPIATYNGTYAGLLAGESIDLTQGTHTVSQAGDYTVRTIASLTGDVSALNDTVTNLFSLSNVTFSRDLSYPLSFNIGPSPTTSTFSTGITYDISSTVVIDSVMLAVAPTVVGGNIYVEIFPVTGGVPGTTPIGRSGLLPVDQTLIDFVATNDLAVYRVDVTDMASNPLTLNPGTYLIAVTQDADVENMELLCSEGIVTDGTWFYHYDSDAFVDLSTTALAPRTPIIRAYVSSPVVVPTITSSDADNTICSGESLTLTSSIATGNTWSTGETTQSIVVTTAGDYTVTVGGQTSAITKVTVNTVAQPTITASGALTFCDGNSVILTSSAASGNTWSTGETTQSISVTTSGTFTVMQTVNGCSASSLSTKVTVNANPPVPTITASGPTTFCTGENVTLSSSSATNNSWNTGAGSQGIIVTSAGNYTVSVTTDGCTSTSAPTAVSVNVGPTISKGTVTPPVSCGTSSGSLEINGSGTGNVIWSGTASGVAPSVSLPYTLTGLSSGSYAAYFIDGNGCRSNTISASLSDPGAPAIPVVTASGPTSFCIGGDVTLTSSTSTGLSWSTGETTQSITVNVAGNYFVTSSVAGCSSISDDVEVVVNDLPIVNAGTYSDVCDNMAPVTLNAGSPSGGSYTGTGVATNMFDPSVGTQTLTYSVTDGNGCTNTAQTTFTVLVSPTVSGGSDVDVCDGETVTLTASGADSYSWDNGVSDGVSFVPTATNTYTVTGTSLNGCSNTASVLVTVNQLPTVGAGVDQTICEGTAAKLNGSGASSYAWNNGVNNGIFFTPTTTTTYVVVGTDLNGCTGTDQVTVTLIPMPTVIATTFNPTTCAGSDGSITVSSAGPSLGTGDVTWTGTASGSATGVSLPYVITGLSSGAYDVIFTNATSCASNTLSESISDPGAPTTPVISASGPVTFCDGENVVLTSSETSGILWSSGETTASITVTTAGTYAVTVTSGACSSTSINVNVVVNASPTIDAGTDVSVCAGESVTLTATSTDAITWNNSITDGVSFVPTVTTTYTATATNADACSTTDEVIVTVNAIPVIAITPVDTVCVTETPVALIATPAGGTFTGTGVTGSDFDVAGLDTGIYVVTYDVTVNGCSATEMMNIRVDSCLVSGIQDLKLLDVMVYPNPSTGLFQIKSEHLSQFNELIVTDQMGRTVYRLTEQFGTEKQLDLSHLSRGNYMLTLQGKAAQARMKIQIMY